MSKNTDKTSKKVEQTNADDSVKLNFYAVDSVLSDNIMTNEESSRSNARSVEWGTNNLWPEYVWHLYNDSATFSAVVNGTTEFICGNSIDCSYDIANIDFDTLVEHCAKDYLLYGGFVINVIRNRAGSICDLKHIPMQRIRTNEDRSVFYYNKDYKKTWLRNATIELPAFDANDKSQGSSIYFYCNSSLNVYPTPIWIGAQKSIDLECEIDNFHLNGIYNQFASSMMITFLDGVPSSENRAQIERKLKDKFCGPKNAARILVNFAPDKEHAVQVDKIESDDFTSKYNAALTRSKNQILSSFRCNAGIIGLPSENSSLFSGDEFAQAYKLYNRSMVRPTQRKITSAIKNILGDYVEFNIAPWSEEID